MLSKQAPERVVDGHVDAALRGVVSCHTVFCRCLCFGYPLELHVPLAHVSALIEVNWVRVVASVLLEIKNGRGCKDATFVPLLLHVGILCRISASLLIIFPLVAV